MATQDHKVYTSKDSSQIRLYMSDRCKFTHHVEPQEGEFTEAMAAKNAHRMVPYFYAKVRMADPEKRKKGNSFYDIRYRVERAENGYTFEAEATKPRYSRVVKKPFPDSDELMERELDAELSPANQETGDENIKDITLDDEEKVEFHHTRLDAKEVPEEIKQQALQLLQRFQFPSQSNDQKPYDLATAANQMIAYEKDNTQTKPHHEDHSPAPKTTIEGKRKNGKPERPSQRQILETAARENDSDIGI